MHENQDRPSDQETKAAEPVDFFSERLRERRRRRAHLPWRSAPRVTRRICLRLAHGSTQVIPAVDETVVVRCASGSLWITHDGDPRDIVLGDDQSYHADREDALRMHALAPCVVEIEFEDDAGHAPSTVPRPS